MYDAITKVKAKLEFLTTALDSMGDDNHVFLTTTRKEGLITLLDELIEEVECIAQDALKQQRP